MPTSPSLPGVLAIDTGNSKTDVLLIGADGSVLGDARGGGFRPHLIGAQSAVAMLAPLVRTAAARAGLPPAENPVAENPVAEHTSACLANADLPVEEERLRKAIEEQGWTRSVCVRNDTFAVLRAGTDDAHGVAVVCGAGVNCVGLLPDGRTVRFPALGRLTGDWGGGEILAVECMWHAVRAEDGRGAATALASAVAAHFNLSSATRVAEAVHLGELEQDRLHEIIPLLFATAATGDATAVGLIDRQADEIVRLALAALTRLDLLDTPTPLVLGGGMLASRQPLLLDNLTARLAVRAPLAEIRLVVAPPVVGAALLGLDHLSAARPGFPAARPADGCRKAQERLRAAYQPPLSWPPL
ncbi:MULTISPECIES: N-acetylglucosamine kinase [Protofrankia]|uniref:ATPase BadF/BadG/BcrA/BcrD type n=1 Tax=Candidatus Protofrankia datiscae TaxID=2716812 RepID=F8B1J4_9ACTN|nr:MULTISPECIES: BadF/BadG/BcrA/BcrD ATPase family protein [Protofrankia]AEH10746.1 ATPase BadF/BadG/BcrA/BcrD type [Candidatus Protofrankia datiscae]